MTHFKMYLLFLGCLFFMSCQEELELDNNSPIEDGTLSDHVRSCSTHAKMEEWLKDPAFKAKHEAKFTRLSAAPALSRSTCANPPLIPVAVHYQGATGADAACLISLAENQIAILNADFGGTNSDISKWTNDASSSFPGLNNGEACLKFCLADKDHPSGYGLQEGNPAVTINQTTGDSNSDFSGYLNIFVQFGTGVLGYAPLGGSGNGDGVVVEGIAFGSGNGCGNIVPQAPYNLGRTTTHEVGHYLLLDHIWGGGCGQDDDVSDTPDSNNPYYDCPSIGASSCGSTDLHMNYMDYTNDACMYMFSAGQISRSENYVSTSLVILTQNAAAKCSESNGGGEEEEEEDEEDEEDEDEDEEEEEGDEEDEDEDDNDNDGPIDSDCNAPAVDYDTGQALTNLECYESTISQDSYCCKWEFDWICMDLYNECLAETDNGGGNEGGGDSGCLQAIDLYNGSILDDNCVTAIQEYDSYCCDIEWDAICQDYYDYCEEYGFDNITSKGNKDVYIAMSKNKIKGQVVFSYSIKDWTEDMEIAIFNGSSKVKSITPRKRRGTIKLDLAGANLDRVSADIMRADRVVAKTSKK